MRLLENRATARKHDKDETFALCTLALALDEKKRELAIAETEIQKLYEQNQALEHANKKLQNKSTQYDRVRSGLKSLRIAAEFDAFRLLDSAKVEAMESIHVGDEIRSELSELLVELANFRHSNLEVSPFVDARAALLERTIDKTLQKLDALKKQFYIENHIPLELSMETPKPPKATPYFNPKGGSADTMSAPIEIFSPFPQLEDKRFY